MKNYMEEVAEMLGVQLNEEFEIVMPNPNCHAVVKLTRDGIKVIEHNIYCTITWLPHILESILTGIYTIKRKPWKPNYGDEYYSIGINGELEPGTWLDDFLDIAMYRLGNCYRTEEEAMKDKQKWIAFCDSDEIINI